MTPATDTLKPLFRDRHPWKIDRSAVVAASDGSAVKALTEVILRGDRFAALTGGPGVGRSAIVDALVVGLADGDIRLVRVRNTAPGPLAVGRLVALIVGGQHTGAGDGGEDDLQRVLHVLTDRSGRESRVVLVIEDAETLETPALALLELLPDLHREGSPRVQILLVGRPGVWTLLADPSRSGRGPIDAPASGEAGAAEGVVAPVSPTLAAERHEKAPEPAIRAAGRQGSPLPFAPPVLAVEGSKRSAPYRGAIAALLVLVLGMAGLTTVAIFAYHSLYRSSSIRAALPPPQEAAPAPKPAGSATAADGQSPVSVPDQPPGPPAVTQAPLAIPEQQAVPSAPPPPPAAPVVAPVTELPPVPPVPAPATKLLPQTPETPPPIRAEPRAMPRMPPEKLRREFDAFLASRGGEVARLNRAQRRELFEQYLARRNDPPSPAAAPLPSR